MRAFTLLTSAVLTKTTLAFSFLPHPIKPITSFTHSPSKPFVNQQQAPKNNIPNQTQITVMSSSTKSNTASDARALNIFTHTPLLKSNTLSTLIKRPTYLKLDTLQQSGSFKDRGMAHLCERLQSTKSTTKLISSSGGNAGLAVATVASQLNNMEVKVVVPKTTKQMVIDKLKSLNADVEVYGENWNEADVLARRYCEEEDGSEYISPYDNPLLWTGHSTLVDEIVSDLNHPDGVKVGAIVVSVGGGGLMCGVLEGIGRHNSLHDTNVVCAETVGAASFGKAFEKKELVRLDSIDSVATSLGALEVTKAALERAAEHEGRGGGVVQSAICTDKEAVNACVQFARDHRILVEPACGAALAVLYEERLREEFLGEGLEEDEVVVVEVCGGSGVSVELLQMWTEQFL